MTHSCTGTFARHRLMLTALSLLAAAPLMAQPAPAPDGPALFRAHCASCHGAQGTGSGPMAPALRRVPPDVTLLSQRNGGVFPEARVRRIIDGRDVESHGSRDMPVWGEELKLTGDGAHAPSVGARIDALTRFIASIQQRRAQ